MNIVHSSEQQSVDRSGGEAGFTIIEMMIAAGVFTIVMISIAGMLEVGRKARFNSLQRNETVRNVRIGLNTMHDDAVNAGINFPNQGTLIPNGWILAQLGVDANAGKGPDYLTPVVPGYQMNAIGPTGSQIKTDQVTFVSQDFTFNNGQDLPLSSIVPAGANFRIDTTKDTASVPNSVCTIGDLYIIIAQNGSGLGMVTNTASTDKFIMSNSDPLNINKPGANGQFFNLVSPATAFRVSFVTYRIEDDGTGTGTGMLVRRIYGGHSSSGEAIPYTDEPIAFGVTNMTISYVLNDETVTNNPAPAQYQNIRQMVVNLSVKSNEVDPKTLKPYTEQLDADFSLLNLGYEKN